MGGHLLNRIENDWGADGMGNMAASKLGFEDFLGSDFSRIGDDAVYINQTRQRISEAPPYDPDLIHEDVGDESYYGHVYRHYGYPPYWGPGYVYPPYPYYP